MTVNENWRQRYNKELMQVFWELDILSFVSTCCLNWISLVNTLRTGDADLRFYITTVQDG